MNNGNLYEMKILEQSKLTAVDLFCGAGIGAYGIKKSGYNILYGIDNDKYAVRTYNHNIGNHAVCDDIRNCRSIPECDLIIATPVCKPFSICGARRLTDDELYGDLLAETLRILFDTLPKALFFENVPGIVIGESLPIFNKFISDIENHGYRTYWKVVDSSLLGAPQARDRLYMVAIRDDIKYEFIPPKESSFNIKTQRDAFWDLRDKPNGYIKNHNTDKLSALYYSSFRSNFRQNRWDEPSASVMSSIQSALLYPEPYVGKFDYKVLHSMRENEDFPRRLSVREHLRLQTVGDEFYFDDDIPLQEQYNRCSGIPSIVAYKYGLAIADCLLGKTNKRDIILKRKTLF